MSAPAVLVCSSTARMATLVRWQLLTVSKPEQLAGIRRASADSKVAVMVPSAITCTLPPGVLAPTSAWDSR